MICIIHIPHLSEYDMCQHVRLFPFMSFIFMKICAQKMFNTVHGYKELDHSLFNYEKILILYCVKYSTFVLVTSHHYLVGK